MQFFYNCLVDMVPITKHTLNSMLQLPLQNNEYLIFYHIYIYIYDGFEGILEPYMVISENFI